MITRDTDGPLGPAHVVVDDRATTWSVVDMRTGEVVSGDMGAAKRDMLRRIIERTGFAPPAAPAAEEG